jgi:Spy/CpxP family protein refolding chaperone
VFDATGALTGQGALIDGSADRSGSTVTHDASGVLAGQCAVIVGIAAKASSSTPIIGGGYPDDYWKRKKKERDDELDAIIRQSIESIVTAEEPPKSKVKKKARRVFRRFIVEDKIDFAALEAAAQANQNLLSVYNALIKAIQEQIEADRMAQYEDEFILLMLSATTVNPITFH